MAFDFPASPTDGQRFSPAGGSTYVWRAATGAWKMVPSDPSATLVISDEPPGLPKPGQLWYESDSGKMFIWYDDGNSQQWVITNVVASVSSGGGGMWVELTQAEYDALSPPDPNTLYVVVG